MAETKLKVYNTQRITDEESMQNFIARKNEFRILVNVIQNTRPDSPPQHQLVIGQRGMGKTTLLKRLEVELRQDPLNKRFLPLLFPEEQYNLDNLSTFWLNCLDAIADILDIQGAKDEVNELDREIERLVSITDISVRTEKAYRFFCHKTFNLGRIPVLLIDNIDFVFRRLNKDELHVLRAYLTESGAPIVIGASSSTVIETDDYDSPFYDAFQTHYLKKLSIQELLEVMRSLASERVRMEISRHKARLKAINQLTGGNPRTAVILFNQIQKGFSDTIVEDLELLLDELTPIYKARYEELSEKQQIIVNAIAMHWDPLSLENIRSLTGLDGGQLSPQLKRLAETGWIEKPLNERYKGGAYELCERMFNIWYLMRRSSRRQKKGVFCLSKYLEAFYENEEELSGWINKLMSGPLISHHHAITALALATLSSDKDARWKLHAKTRAYIKANPNFIQQIETSDLYDNIEEALMAYIEAVKQNDAQQILISTESLLTATQKSVLSKQLFDIIIKNRAIAFVEISQFEEGIKLLDSHPELKGVSPIWVNLAAGVHNKKGQAEIVEYCLHKAIASDSKNGEAYLYLAKLYTELSKFEEADNALVKASSLIKNDSMVLMLAKGVLYSQYKREDEGEKYLKEFLDNEGDNVEALFYLGRFYFRQRSGDYGLSLFKKCLSFDPDNLLVLSWTHVAKEQLDQKDGVDIVVDVECRVSEKDEAKLYRRIASVYDSEGLSDWAYKYWGKSVSLEENDTESLISMVEYCLNEDMLEEATTNIKKLLDIEPDNSSGLFLAGAVYYSLGNYAKTREFLSRAIQVHATGELYHFLGIVYERESNYLEAKKCYLKALDSGMEGKGAVIRDLGVIERDKFKDFSAAEACFVTLKDVQPYLLISLYRDYMDRSDEARALFDALPFPEDNPTEYELEQILFNIRDGLFDNAHQLLCNCIGRFKSAPDFSSLPVPFYHFYSMCLRYKCGEWLLQEFDTMGLREDLAPDYHAIKALISPDPDAYLDTVALEIREISKQIISQMN